MSPRSRLLEIMNAADLARLQDAQAATQAQAQAANTGQWVSLLQSVPSVVGGLAGTYQKSVADDAATAAKQAIADNAGATGDHGTKEYAGPTEDGSPLMGPDPTKYAGTAGDVAQKTVSGNAALNPSKPTGIFDSVLSIIGDKEGAAAKARADASTGIASEVQANRDKATALDRQQAQDAQSAANVNSEIGQRTFEQGRQKSLDVYTKQDRARALIPGIVAGGIANGQAPDDIAARAAQMPGMDALSSDELSSLVTGEHQKQAQGLLDTEDTRKRVAQEAADKHVLAGAQVGNLNREHQGTNGKPKELQPEMLDKFVTGPRALIDKLNTLGSTEIPDDATGLQGGLASWAEKEVPVAGPMLSQQIAPDRNDVVTSVLDTVVAANNSMDRKTTKESLDIWKKQLEGALAKGPGAFQKAVGIISGDLRKAQTAREAALKASNYDVPVPPLAAQEAASSKPNLAAMKPSDLAGMSMEDLLKLASGGG